MIFGFGKVPGERLTRAHHELEAARVLEQRIAEGRPPPDVWWKAEEWRAKHGQAGRRWYTPATTEPTGGTTTEPEPGRQLLSRRRRRASIINGDPLVLHVVRPPAAVAATSSRQSGFRARAVKANE